MKRWGRAYFKREVVNAESPSLPQMRVCHSTKEPTFRRSVEGFAKEPFAYPYILTDGCRWSKQCDMKTVTRYDHGRENLDQNAVNFLGYDEE